MVLSVYIHRCLDVDFWQGSVEIQVSWPESQISFFTQFFISQMWVQNVIIVVSHLSSTTLLLLKLLKPWYTAVVDAVLLMLWCSCADLCTCAVHVHRPCSPGQMIKFTSSDLFNIYGSSNTHTHTNPMDAMFKWEHLFQTWSLNVKR